MLAFTPMCLTIKHGIQRLVAVRQQPIKHGIYQPPQGSAGQSRVGLFHGEVSMDENHVADTQLGLFPKPRLLWTGLVYAGRPYRR